MYRKIFRLVLLTIAVTLSACTQKQSSPTLNYTESGIGVLQFGARIDELPQKVEGMYDRIESVYDDFDGGVYNYLYLGDELQYTLTWDDYIMNITVYDKNVDFGGFSVGDPITKIMSFDWRYELTNYGMSVYINDCYLQLGNAFSESGNDKFQSAYARLEDVRYDKNDFKSGATLDAVTVTRPL